MFNTLFTLFKDEFKSRNMLNVLDAVHDILSEFHEDYLKDKNAKNAAIDCIIQILEQHKDK